MTLTAEPATLINVCEIKHDGLKRAFDILFSLFALLLTGPFLLLLGVLVTLTSSGHAIYGHRRVGRGGKAFRCYKFRTMYLDADKRLELLLASDPLLKEEWDKNHKLKNDPRVTPLGKFLRKTSLDEFPQFWNVLKGDLSIVGPRPVVYQELTKFYGEQASHVLSVRPGLTGPWQISGRSNVSYAERVRMDVDYVNNRNFLLDLTIIIKTIPAMLSSRGAY